MLLADTLRQHPELKDLFKAAESRHFKDDELGHYRRTVPEFSLRADAASAMREVDGAVVKKVIRGIYDRYPYEEFHQFAMAKCVRDVRYVTAYATLAMLMGDADWFKDKLLFWLKTILQSFRYPDLSPGKDRLHASDPHAMAIIAKLQAHQRSIFEIYYGVKLELKLALDPAAFDEMEPFLQAAVEILPSD